jgi:hypothetical protein
MIAILMVTLLFMLAFAVNVGMLVHAKINLQNAADLAAYAGASTQARQLNAISFLNYEMRRQYKRFLYRYYTIGNLSQPGYPRSGGGRGRHSFAANSGAPPYGAPVICVNFEPQDNYCQVSQLRPIAVPPPNPLDQISTALNAQLTQIEMARRASCDNIGRMNQVLAALWIYNTDPTLDSVAQALESTSDTRTRTVLTSLRAIARGLGIVPKLFLLRKRIQTLADYVNLPAIESLKYEQVSTMVGEANAARNERMIQSYLSAYHTLGEHLFDSDSIEMTELMQTPQLRLEEQRASFEIYPIDLEQVPGGDGTCNATPVPYGVRNIPVGVYKDPRFLTYYALRLKARARLLFNPFGRDLEMTAYSAAQPFGSRIGPKLQEDFFTVEVSQPVRSCTGSDPGGSRITTCQNRIPATHIFEDAGPDAWQMPEVLSSLYGAMSAGGDPNTDINLAAVNRGFQAAMAPNPWEAGKYNIPGGLENNDPFVDYFGPSNQMAIWAPLMEGNSANELESMAQEFLQQISSIGLGSSTSSMSSGTLQNIASGLTAGFTQYISRLQAGQGESDVAGGPGENIKFYRMSNPYAGTPLAGRIALSDMARAKSSWNEVHNDAFKSRGRTGYSVKFVAFKHLNTPSDMTTDGSQIWENRPIEDPESEGVYDRLHH